MLLGRRLGTALQVGESEGLPWVVDDDQPKAKHIAKRAAEQRVKLDHPAAAAIRLLILTGARPREVLHLRWQHVDLERGLLLLTNVLVRAGTKVSRCHPGVAT